MPSFVFESSSFYCTTGVNFLFLTSPIYMLTSGMATFDEDDCYDQSDSAGFIHLFGLPLKVRALNDQELFGKAQKHFPSVE